MIWPFQFKGIGFWPLLVLFVWFVAVLVVFGLCATGATNVCKGW